VPTLWRSDPQLAFHFGLGESKFSVLIDRFIWSGRDLAEATRGVGSCKLTWNFPPASPTVAVGQKSGFGSGRPSHYASGGRSKQVGDSSRHGTRSTHTVQ